jgi:hypothetical protein
MAHAKQRSEWRRTASIMALIAETNRDPKQQSQPFTEDDFDPFAGEYTKRDEAMEMTESDKARFAEIFNNQCN